MSPATRTTLLFTVAVVVLLLLGWRGGSYALERVALELRYFWWLVLILVGGLWLLMVVGRTRK